MWFKLLWPQPQVYIQAMVQMEKLNVYDVLRRQINADLCFIKFHIKG